MDEEIPTGMRRVRSALIRLASEAEGRHDAFEFALGCLKQDDPMKCIQDRIQERQEGLDERLRSDPCGPMSSGATPRIYQDAYIATLRDAVAIVAVWAEARK